MKSFLKYFVEFDEKETTKSPSSSSTNTQPITNNVQPNYVPQVNPQIDTSKFANHFDTLFEEQNLPGPDYFEFQNTLKSILQGGIPETSAYNVSFTALKSMGLTKDKLVTSAQQYITILDKDVNDFKNEVLLKNNIEIESRKKQIEDNVKLVNDKIALIAKLNQEISDLNSKNEQLNHEITQTQNKIQNAEGGYMIVAEKRKQEIQSHIEKIQNFIA